MVEFLRSEWRRLLCWHNGDAALELLCPIVVNLIIPRYYLLSCFPLWFISATFLLFNHPSSVSLAPLSSACLLLCSELFILQFGIFQSGAKQGVDGTRDMTLKMWLGWMAALCHRGSGRLFQLCLKTFFLPADLRDRFSLCRSDGLTGRTGQAGFCRDVN